MIFASHQSGRGCNLAAIVVKSGAYADSIRSIRFLEKRDQNSAAVSATAISSTGSSSPKSVVPLAVLDAGLDHMGTAAVLPVSEQLFLDRIDGREPATIKHKIVIAKTEGGV
jgi:hypothetical protein